MKDLSAGIIAGAIAGFLFPLMIILVVFMALGGRIDLQNLASTVSTILATRGLMMPLQAIIVFMFVGFALLSLASVISGAILGVVFAKIVNKLPMRSIYPKALGFGILLYLLLSLPRLVFSRLLDIYSLAATIIDSLIFGFLFMRFTRPNKVAVDQTK